MFRYLYWETTKVVMQVQQWLVYTDPKHGQMCLLTCVQMSIRTACVFILQPASLLYCSVYGISLMVSLSLSGSRTGSAYHCPVIQYLWKIYLTVTFNTHFLFTPSEYTLVLTIPQALLLFQHL